jgi:hypothetical protein
MLTQMQTKMASILLQKIDRRTRPIRRFGKTLNQSLKKKNIHLDQPNFDILTLMQSNFSNSKILPISASNQPLPDQTFDFPSVPN